MNDSTVSLTSIQKVCAQQGYILFYTCSDEVVIGAKTQTTDSTMKAPTQPPIKNTSNNQSDTVTMMKNESKFNLSTQSFPEQKRAVEGHDKGDMKASVIAPASSPSASSSEESSNKYSPRILQSRLKMKYSWKIAPFKYLLIYITRNLATFILHNVYFFSSGF
jgi:hypothetical protein